MIEIISVSVRGQIVIPQKLRNRLGIQPGSKLVLFEKDNAILLKKEEDVAKQFESDEGKEAAGWMALAEQSLRKVWDNPNDEKVWRKYHRSLLKR